MNQFAEQMSKKSNAQLLKILYEQRSDYQPEAIVAAEAELSNRNLSQTQYNNAEVELDASKHFEENRASKPLEPGLKILAALFPGIFLIILSAIFKADGYDRKAKELVKWTVYGVVFYVLFVLFVLVVNFI